jgi:hypothetical protein
MGRFEINIKEKSLSFDNLARGEAAFTSPDI